MLYTMTKAFIKPSQKKPMNQENNVKMIESYTMLQQYIMPHLNPNKKIYPRNYFKNALIVELTQYKHVLLNLDTLNLTKPLNRRSLARKKATS